MKCKSLLAVSVIALAVGCSEYINGNELSVSAKTMSNGMAKSITDGRYSLISKEDLLKENKFVANYAMFPSRKKTPQKMEPYDSPRFCVSIGYFNYDIYPEIKKAAILFNSRYSWWEDNSYDEKMSKALPDGKLVIPDYIRYEGVDYPITHIEEFGAEEIKEITLPKYLEYIGNGALQRTSIKSLIVPDGVIEISYDAFADCPYLESIEFGSCLESLSVIAMKRSPSIKTVKISEQNRYYKVYGDYIVSKDEKDLCCCYKWNKEVINDLPLTIEKIKEDMFFDFPNLKSVTLPSGLKEIEVRAFASCKYLSEMVLPESLELIGHNAFSGTSIRELRIPDSVYYLQNCSDMEELEKIYIGKGLEWIGSGPSQDAGHGIFAGCRKLKEIIVSPENNYWKSENNLLLNKQGTMLATVPGSMTTLDNIPESIVDISSGSLCYTNINKLILPPKLYKMPGRSLEGITLNHSLDIPYTLRAFNWDIFYGFGNSDVNFHSPIAQKAPWDWSLDCYDGHIITLHVPKGSAENYRNSSHWNTFPIVDDLPAENKYAIDFDYSGRFEPSGYLVGGPARESAIMMPAKVAAGYEGCKIDGVSFSNHLAHGAYAFVYRASDNKLLAYGDATPMDYHSHIFIPFDTPYIINKADGDLLIGVCLTEGGMIEISRFRNAEGNYMRETSNDEWIKGFCGDMGTFMIAASIDSDHIPVDGAIREIEYPEVISNGNLHVTGYMENMSPDVAKSMTIAYSVNPATRESESVNGEYVLTGVFPHHELVPFEFDIPVSFSGNCTVSIDVAKIDGKVDEVAGNGSGELSFRSAGKGAYSRRVVLEEGTGTWCPYCTRGIAGIKLMKEKYPDTFIGIAMHNDDEMYPESNYSEMFGMSNSYPWAIVNRKSNYMIDPNFNSIEKMYQMEKDLATVDIKARANYTNTAKEKINVDMTAYFSPESTGEYRLATAVIEHKVGPYYQSSAYSAEELGIPDINFSYMLFDDVAREIYYASDNTKAGNVTNVAYNGSQNFTMTVEVPRNVNNQDNLEIIAMIINKNTGEIENAYASKIAAVSESHIYETTEIAPTVESEGLIIKINNYCLPFDVYSIDGKNIYSGNDNKVTMPNAGLYIVKAGKSVFKVICK